MRINILGNGPQTGIYERGTEGKLLICNMPPFEYLEMRCMLPVWLTSK